MRELSFVIFSEQEEFAQEMQSPTGHASQGQGRGSLRARSRASSSSIKSELPDVLFVDLGLAPSRGARPARGHPDPAARAAGVRLTGREPPDPPGHAGGSQGVSCPRLRRPTELAAAVERLFRTTDTTPVGSGEPPLPVIAVMGAKGGVGATVVASQLAASLQNTGSRTVLIDLNFPLGDVALHFDVDPDHTIADVVKGDECRWTRPSSERDPQRSTRAASRSLRRPRPTSRTPSW